MPPSLGESSSRDISNGAPGLRRTLSLPPSTGSQGALQQATQRSPDSTPQSGAPVVMRAHSTNDNRSPLSKADREALSKTTFDKSGPRRAGGIADHSGIAGDLISSRKLQPSVKPLTESAKGMDRHTYHAGTLFSPSNLKEKIKPLTERDGEAKSISPEPPSKLERVEKLLEAIDNYFSKPIKERVIKPFDDWFEKNVEKPLDDYAAKPFLKPIAKYVLNPLAKLAKVLAKVLAAAAVLAAKTAWYATKMGLNVAAEAWNVAGAPLLQSREVDLIKNWLPKGLRKPERGNSPEGGEKSKEGKDTDDKVQSNRSDDKAAQDYHLLNPNPQLNQHNSH